MKTTSGTGPKSPTRALRKARAIPAAALLTFVIAHLSGCCCCYPGVPTDPTVGVTASSRGGLPSVADFKLEAPDGTEAVRY